MKIRLGIMFGLTHYEDDNEDTPGNNTIIYFIETRLQDIQFSQQQKYRWLG